MELPKAFRCELGELSCQKGMLPPSRKAEAVHLFKKYNVEFIEVGTGTNRFITKYDGYAFKIALDKEGIADNKQEYAICDRLGPGAAYSYEISKGGHLMFAQYCGAFTSYQEFWNKRGEIIPILKDWSTKFLLGDVGISKINYANWGLFGNKSKCIDYAYLFPADLKLFQCLCGEYNMGLTDNTFTQYKCLCCGRVYRDRDLRQRVTPEERMRLLANATKDSLEMIETKMTKDIDDMAMPFRYNPDAPSIY